MGQARIFVLKLREIIYAAVFIALGILFIILLVSIFTKDKATPTAVAQYKSGIYTSSFLLDQQPVNIEVTVDSNHINSVKIKDLNETTELFYPLLTPVMSHIESQLINDTELSSIQIGPGQTYTSYILLSAIEKALEKASSEDLHKR